MMMMMLNRTGPVVRVPLIDRRSRSVGAGRHLGVGERVRPTRGPHLLLLLLLCCCVVLCCGVLCCAVLCCVVLCCVVLCCVVLCCVVLCCVVLCCAVLCCVALCLLCYADVRSPTYDRGGL